MAGKIILFTINLLIDFVMIYICYYACYQSCHKHNYRWYIFRIHIFPALRPLYGIAFLPYCPYMKFSSLWNKNYRSTKILPGILRQNRNAKLFQFCLVIPGDVYYFLHS